MSYERIHLPLAPEGSGSSPEALGDEFDWGGGIPMLYRAIAAPYGVERVLAAPGSNSQDEGRHEDALRDACAYWGALLHLLVFSFGWTNPALGLLTWLRAGQCGEDPRLGLLSETYGRDQQLGALIDYLSTSPAATKGVWAALATKRGLPPVAARPVPSDFGALVGGQYPPRGTPSPAPSGGTDPLHLSSHLHEGLRRGRGVCAVVDRRQRTAIFTSPSMEGWYEALSREGDALQIEPGRSWRVDVYCRPVGWMGTYRRSRTTNIWFSGRHRHHLWGNTPAA